MNTTSETTASAVIGASERMHDVAAPSAQRKQRYYPKSALQKLLSMVEPIMRPLTADMAEPDKEEFHVGGSHNIEEILSNSGQRNAFQLYLRARETPSSSYVKEFSFLCLCREFREWGDKVQYGPYRIRVLANYIYQNFIREGCSQSLQLSHVIRKNIERTISDSRTINPAMFEEAYQYVSLLIIQQNVLKSFVESHYYQTMWHVDDMDCNLFKALSLGGGTGPSCASRGAKQGSAGSSTASSCTSSRSRVSRTNFFGEPLSSEASSPAVSEIQSISSRGTGSSKSSTGSNASAAFDKYYCSKNTQKKAHKKNPAPVVPARLMEELLPRLQVISLEQTMRVQNFGSLENGPHGGDTPVVVLKRQEQDEGDTSPVEMSTLNHMTHHALPQTIDMPFQSHHLPDKDAPKDETMHSASCNSEEAMLCEDSREAWPSSDHAVANSACTVDSQQSASQQSASQQSASQQPPQIPTIQIAYTFGSGGICYGKVLPGPHVTLRQFKGIVQWGSSNARYFFKRQVAGIGEVHDELTCDDAILPFWAPATIFARVESGPD